MVIAEPLGWPYDLLTLEEWNRLEPHEEHRTECVEGALVLAPRPHYRHQIISTELVTQLKAQLPADLVAIPDVDILLTEVPLTMRAPDLVVVPLSVIQARPDQLTARDVRLVVEIVSPGSRRMDRVMKRDEYAEAGIAEYWLLDGEPLTLTAYALDGSSYRLTGEFAGLSELEACGEPIRLDIGALPEPWR